MKKKTIRIIILAIVTLVIGAIAYGAKVVSSGFDIDKTVYLYIVDSESSESSESSRSYDDLMKQLEETAHIRSRSDFEIVASALSYKSNLRSGRYAVTPDMTVLGLVRKLRNGQQSPVNLTFNNIRTKQDLANRIGEQLEMGGDKLFAALSDTAVCRSYGLEKETIVAMFIPNTYQFYWNTSLDDFLDKMSKEHKQFWNEERSAKAQGIGLSPAEVATLASIVEEECTYGDEYKTVAGLYLNRLKIGQRLQADPTVKFAVGDFSLRRILYVHLETESPYNTYMYAGLPPGPIRVPSIKGIDEVLNHQTHNYYYMCAKEDFSGRHNFAATYREHEQNANRYRRALNARSIK